MGHGREGSPPRQAAEAQRSAAAPSRKMSPSVHHKLEREELPGKQMILDPSISSSPSHSPRSTSPLPVSDLPPPSHRSPVETRTPHDGETGASNPQSMDRAHTFFTSSAIETAPSLDLRLRGRRRSSRAAEKTLAEASKGSLRKAKPEPIEIQDGDLGARIEEKDKARSKRLHAHQYTRQHKRKASDSLPTLPLAVPHHHERAPLDASSEPRRSSSSASSRRFAKEARILPENSDWLQFAVDVIMWTHVPRSWLLFGVGCFCMLSTSVIQDMNCSIVSVISYLVLTYLIAIFLRQSIAHRATSVVQPLSCLEFTEADVVKATRIVLPMVNTTLKRLSQLFSGDPATTLKVAIALWLLAQSGYIMSFWTFIRLAYLAVFIIPKFYASYYNELHEYGQKLIQWGLVAWNSCTYKKSILFAISAVAWSLFSTLSRIFGGFVLLIALRVYKQGLGSEQPNSNFIHHESDGPFHLNEMEPSDRKE